MIYDTVLIVLPDVTCILIRDQQSRISLTLDEVDAIACLEQGLSGGNGVRQRIWRVAFVDDWLMASGFLDDTHWYSRVL
jgi:hypothetical protein